MISVLNRLQPSSGNKWFVFLTIGIVLGACSPKIRQVVNTPVKPAEVKKVPEKPKPVVPPVPLLASKITTISLILPFELDKLDLGANATKSGLNSAILSVDYYQGFKMALDSLTAAGYNYKLQVFDSKGEVSQAHSLALNPKIRTSDLIIGPVFPDAIKEFTLGLAGVAKPIVSPLSPANPKEFKVNNLVTVNPPLEYHTWKIAQFINDNVRPKKVFILKSGFSEENKFTIPFKRAIDSLSKKNIKVVYLTVVRGNLDILIPQLSATDENIFVVPATDEAFLTVTIASLDKLSQTYPVTLFGHPGWEKMSFLHPDVLERLKTYITESDRINFKSATIVKFTKAYRKVFHTDPGEYAIKGFDEGFYFGKMMSMGYATFDNMNAVNFDGMHNQFNFVKIEGSGWINTHVSLYQYQNFELKQVE